MAATAATGFRWWRGVVAMAEATVEVKAAAAKAAVVTGR